MSDLNFFFCVEVFFLSRSQLSIIIALSDILADPTTLGPGDSSGRCILAARREGRAWSFQCQWLPTSRDYSGPILGTSLRLSWPHSILICPSLREDRTRSPQKTTRGHTQIFCPKPPPTILRPNSGSHLRSVAESLLSGHKQCMATWPSATNLTKLKKWFINAPAHRRRRAS